MRSKKSIPLIGITLGDPAGVGPEVIVKALARAPKPGRFLVIGDKTAFRFGRGALSSGYDFYDLKMVARGDIVVGKGNEASARASLAYIDAGITLLRQGAIQALVTGPVCKEGISQILHCQTSPLTRQKKGGGRSSPRPGGCSESGANAERGLAPLEEVRSHCKNLSDGARGKHFQGHTEYLAEAFGVKNFEMMFVGRTLRTIVVTRHVPLAKVSSLITREKMLTTLRLGQEAMTKFFIMNRPRIAVCGLNPHAGEGGSIGREEIDVIIPAMNQAKAEGIEVQGPFAADTIFCPTMAKNFDLIISMYHDQGLVGVKALYFKELVNMTVGLPFIRTSPAHGTAFNIAGKNQADPSSMAAALNLAARLGALKAKSSARVAG